MALFFQNIILGIMSSAFPSLCSHLSVCTKKYVSAVISAACSSFIIHSGFPYPACAFSLIVSWYSTCSDCSWVVKFQLHDDWWWFSTLQFVSLKSTLCYIWAAPAWFWTDDYKGQYSWNYWVLVKRVLFCFWELSSRSINFQVESHYQKTVPWIAQVQGDRAQKRMLSERLDLGLDAF